MDEPAGFWNNLTCIMVSFGSSGLVRNFLTLEKCGFGASYFYSICLIVCFFYFGASLIGSSTVFLFANLCDGLSSKAFNLSSKILPVSWANPFLILSGIIPGKILIGDSIGLSLFLAL